MLAPGPSEVEVEDLDARGGLVPVAIRLRPAARGERAFVAALGGASLARLGDYDRILGEWFDHPSVSTLVACAADRCVGFAMWAFIHGADGPVADVVAIAVEPGWRRLGIGRALLRGALAQARLLASSARVVEIELSVAEDNGSAAALFESEGFARRPEADTRYPGGQRCLRLARPLNVEGA